MTHQPQRRAAVFSPHINYSGRPFLHHVRAERYALRWGLRHQPAAAKIHQEVKGRGLAGGRSSIGRAPRAPPHQTACLFGLERNRRSQSKPVDPRGRGGRPGPADWELLELGRSFPARCVSRRPTGNAPSAAASRWNRCRRGRPRCRTQPDSPFRLYPAPETTQRTPRRAPEATTQTRLVRFHISYALFEPRGKSDAARVAAANLDRPH